jgi:hypothetical protein
MARGARLSILARRLVPPPTGRIYDRTRSDGKSVSDRSLDIREESIYGLLSGADGNQQNVDLS